MGVAANCITIAQFPVEIHSEQGQFAKLLLKTKGKLQNLGDHYAIRSSCATDALRFELRQA
eukprot:COSAG02_NODE_32157_length_521_cov_0.857820_1_plen_60_part_10